MEGSGFRVQRSGFRVQGSGFRIEDSKFRVWCLRIRTQDSGLGVLQKTIILKVQKKVDAGKAARLRAALPVASRLTLAGNITVASLPHLFTESIRTILKSTFF